MKRPDSLLVEYNRKLSDDDLNFVVGRLTQRLSGDLPEVLTYFSKNADLDYWLSTSKNSWEVYDMLDDIQKFADKEYNKRFEIKT